MTWRDGSKADARADVDQAPPWVVAREKSLRPQVRQVLDTRKSQRTIPAPLEAGSMAQVLRADRSLPAAGPGKGWPPNRIFERLGSLTFEREWRVVGRFAPRCAYATRAGSRFDDAGPSRTRIELKERNL
jgi:hypothetical protein